MVGMYAYCNVRTDIYIVDARASFSVRLTGKDDDDDGDDYYDDEE